MAINRMLSRLPGTCAGRLPTTIYSLIRQGFCAFCISEHWYTTVVRSSIMSAKTSSSGDTRNTSVAASQKTITNEPPLPNHTLEDSKLKLSKVITIPNVVKFIKKCGAKQTNSFALSVQLRKNYGSPTNIDIHAWPSRPEERIGTNAIGASKLEYKVPLDSSLYHWYIHGLVQDGDNSSYYCGVYLDMNLLTRRFALFGCECMSKDKTPGRACQHTLALLSYVREKIQHVPYKFVNNVKSSMSVLEAGGLRESYFKISHVSTKNEIFIPRDQNITLGRLSLGSAVGALYNDSCCSRNQLVLKHHSSSNRFTIMANRVMNHPRVFPQGLKSYFFILPPLYTMEMMNEYCFSMYYGLHFMRVEQFHKLEKSNDCSEHDSKKCIEQTLKASVEEPVQIGNKTDVTVPSSNATDDKKAERIMDELECAICCELLYKPVSIACLHKFCESCWYSWALTCLDRKDKVRCPTCRESTLNYVSRIDTSTASICNMMFPEQYKERKDNVDESSVQMNKALLQGKMDALKRRKSSKNKRRKITGYFNSGGSDSRSEDVIDLS